MLGQNFKTRDKLRLVWFFMRIKDFMHLLHELLKSWRTDLSAVRENFDNLVI